MSTDANAPVRRAQAGERVALAQLVEAHQAQVYSLALSVMRNPADAADMTQETFLRVMRTLHTFRGEQSTFATWLHRLTINVCLDGLRRQRRQPAAELSLDGAEATVQHAFQEPEVWVVEREAAADVQAALCELPLPQRLALTLHYLEGSSYEQVASVMRQPLNTVKSHIARGKERMARLMSQRARAPRFDTVLSPSPRRNPRLVLVAA